MCLIDPFTLINLLVYQHLSFILFELTSSTSLYELFYIKLEYYYIFVLHLNNSLMIFFFSYIYFSYMKIQQK